MVQRLDSIANDTIHFGSSNARAVITLLTGKIYPFNIVYPSFSSPRKAKVDTIQFKLSEKFLLIYPNPFTSETTVEAMVPDASKSQYLIISDVVGKQLNIYQLKTGHNVINISTNTLEAGIYFASLMSDGKTVSTARLLKIN